MFVPGPAGMPRLVPGPAGMPRRRFPRTTPTPAAPATPTTPPASFLFQQPTTTQFLQIFGSVCLSFYFSTIPSTTTTTTTEYGVNLVCNTMLLDVIPYQIGLLGTFTLFQWQLPSQMDLCCSSALHFIYGCATTQLREMQTGTGHHQLFVALWFMYFATRAFMSFQIGRNSDNLSRCNISLRSLFNFVVMVPLQYARNYATFQWCRIKLIWFTIYVAQSFQFTSRKARNVRRFILQRIVPHPLRLCVALVVALYLIMAMPMASTCGYVGGYNSAIKYSNEVVFMRPVLHHSAMEDVVDVEDVEEEEEEEELTPPVFNASNTTPTRES
jgi:hypothetical protein